MKTFIFALLIASSFNVYSASTSKECIAKGLTELVYGSIYLSPKNLVELVPFIKDACEEKFASQDMTDSNPGYFKINNVTYNVK